LADDVGHLGYFGVHELLRRLSDISFENTPTPNSKFRQELLKPGSDAIIVF
jgi:hypothetical protein